jgi:probable HAF family extracellular repeat protein
MMIRRLGLACLVALLVAAPAAGAALNYTVTELAPLGGQAESGARAINPRGDVVGFSTDTGEHAVLWTVGNEATPTSLGDLGGAWSEARGINNARYVVGTSVNAGARNRGFIWYNGTMYDLGTLPGGNEGTANGINAALQIAGTSDRTDGYTRACLLRWNPTLKKVVVRRDLGTLDGDNAVALAVSPAGVVVGQADTLEQGPFGGMVSHAFRWSAGVMHDLGTFPGVELSSSANAISPSGAYIVGVGDSNFILPTPTDPSYRSGLMEVSAFWRSACGYRMRSYGTLQGLESVTFGVNDSNYAVGQFIPITGAPFSKDPADVAAFLWPGAQTANRGIQSLSNLVSDGTWQFTAAYAINNNGWIVGDGIHNGVKRGFLLKPAP